MQNRHYDKIVIENNLFFAYAILLFATNFFSYG